jgi:hypothetical protein
MYVYVGNRKISTTPNSWNIWKDRDKTVKITSQVGTKQPGEQVGKWKTKGRTGWL